MAAAKKGKKLPEARGRKRIDNELKQFAIVQEDNQNEFALRLETLALKKSIYMYLSRLRLSWMHGLTWRRLKRKAHKKRRQRLIDTSIPKLRVKYKGMND